MRDLEGEEALNDPGDPRPIVCLVLGGKDRKHLGTGWLYDADRVVTCAHVVKGKETEFRLLFVGAQDGEDLEMLGDRVDHDVEADVSILGGDYGQVLGPDHACNLSATVPVDEAKLRGFGFPGLLNGVVRSLNGEVDSSQILRLGDARVRGFTVNVQELSQKSDPGGWSGSPLVMGGQIVGMARAIPPVKREPDEVDRSRRFSAFGTLYAIPPFVIKDSLKRTERAAAPSPGSMSASSVANLDHGYDAVVDLHFEFEAKNVLRRIVRTESKQVGGTQAIPFSRASLAKEERIAAVSSLLFPDEESVRTLLRSVAGGLVAAPRPSFNPANYRVQVRVHCPDELLDLPWSDARLGELGLSQMKWCISIASACSSSRSLRRMEVDVTRPIVLLAEEQHGAYASALRREFGAIPARGRLDPLNASSTSQLRESLRKRPAILGAELSVEGNRLRLGEEKIAPKSLARLIISHQVDIVEIRLSGDSIGAWIRPLLDCAPLVLVSQVGPDQDSMGPPERGSFWGPAISKGADIRRGFSSCHRGTTHLVASAVVGVTVYSREMPGPPELVRYALDRELQRGKAIRAVRDLRKEERARHLLLFGGGDARSCVDGLGRLLRFEFDEGDGDRSYHRYFRIPKWRSGVTPFELLCDAIGAATSEPNEQVRLSQLLSSLEHAARQQVVVLEWPSAPNAADQARLLQFCEDLGAECPSLLRVVSVLAAEFLVATDYAAAARKFGRKHSSRDASFRFVALGHLEFPGEEEIAEFLESRMHLDSEAAWDLAELLSERCDPHFDSLCEWLEWGAELGGRWTDLLDHLKAGTRFEDLPRDDDTLEEDAD